MKVLFAVSSESISEAIIKRYQKEYKEILSYKNVYYFNAILKEIQRDKTYDRIIISEDLEPFSNNNYDTIDKFIFEKLDSISDEAQDSNGKETSIILICTDRRQKGNAFLVKIFGIGVYNALLGNDRSMEEVCKLISKPRNKKEAKIYYRIDTDDVNYRAENENEVSEVEIQNILAHFKKLGKNTAKYSDSFNNIAVQYNDEQLKIIVNCLPINVKAVLETECERYQELMAVTGGIRSVKNMVASTGVIEGTVKSGLNSKNVGQAGNITKPIVIPSAVKNAKNQAQVLKKPVESAQTAKPTVQKATTMSNVENIQPNKVNTSMQSTHVLRKNPQSTDTQQVITPKAPEARVVARPTTSGFQRPRRPIPGMLRTNSVQNNKSEEMLPGFEEEASNEGMLPGFEDEAVDEEMLPGFEEETSNEGMLPGFEDEAVDEEMLPGFEEETTNEKMLPGFDEETEEISDTTENSVKRGRGRPRKTPVEGAIIKPKGKRGRPRKNIDIEEASEYEEVKDESTLLPGMDNEDEFTYDEPTDEAILPGFEDDYIEDNNNIEVSNNNVDEESDEETDDATMLPGMGFDEEEYTDEVMLPELDSLDDYDENTSSNYENIAEDTGEMLPGFEEDSYQDTSDLDSSVSEIDDGLLPGIDNIDSNIDNISYSNFNNNVVESIKPRVDYSMSSLNSLITKDKKIAAFIGTSKNGVSFLVNNLAALFSSLGINTAILDMTKNKNSYYIYTNNKDELRNIAFSSIEKLQNGYAEGIRIDKNLTVYTALPNDGKDYSNAEPILSTLIQSHSLVLIDCDYDTDLTYFASCQELYLVQSMDILTIQPLTAFLRELKTKGILEPEKIRVVINKELKVKSLSIKALIAGMSYYNDPAMSFMTELFNKDIVKACTIPFEDNAYSKYLEGIVNCNISLNGFSKAFLSKLKVLGDMVYPLTSKQTYGKGAKMPNYNQNTFSNSTNDTLNKMRKKY